MQSIICNHLKRWFQMLPETKLQFNRKGSKLQIFLPWEISTPKKWIKCCKTLSDAFCFLIKMGRFLNLNVKIQIRREENHTNLLRKKASRQLCSFITCIWLSNRIHAWKVFSAIIQHSSECTGTNTFSVCFLFVC